MSWAAERRRLAGRLGRIAVVVLGGVALGTSPAVAHRDRHELVGGVADAPDTEAVLRHDDLRRASVAPVQEIACCGFTATAIVERD